MWYPGYGVNQELKKLILACLDDSEIKNEIARQVRIEVDNERKKYKGTIQSYDSLTSGNVNMQAKMAASGYDVYGRTIISGNYNANNNNIKVKYSQRKKPPVHRWFLFSLLTYIGNY